MTEGALTKVPFSRERLERAQHCVALIDVVGFQEDFESFCGELSTRFKWDLGPPVFMNRSTPFPVSEAFRRRIADDNALDIELYEFARRTRAPSAPYRQNTSGI